MPTVNKPSKLSESIRNLKPSAARLNKLADEAAETVKAVEAFLSEDCSLGIMASVCFDDRSHPQHPEDCTGTYLQYRRVGPKFRIAITDRDTDGNDLDVKAWADSPRDLKLESYPRLPDLLIRLNEVANQQITETEEATKSITTTLQALLSATK